MMIDFKGVFVRGRQILRTFKVSRVHCLWVVFGVDGHGPDDTGLKIALGAKAVPPLVAYPTFRHWVPGGECLSNQSTINGASTVSGDNEISSHKTHSARRR